MKKTHLVSYMAAGVLVATPIGLSIPAIYAATTSNVTNTYTVHTSNPPSIASLKITDAITNSPNVTQGDPLKLTAKLNIPLWAGLAAYHYDAVEIINNSTHNSTWLNFNGKAVNVKDNGQTLHMTSEKGGHGILTDTLTTSVDLPNGSYTAKFWTADGVHRLSVKPATTNFIVDSGSSITLSADPIQLATGQQVALASVVTGSAPQYVIRLVDRSGNDVSTDGDVNYDVNSGKAVVAAIATANG